jgi:hypothetical protein
MSVGLRSRDSALSARAWRCEERGGLGVALTTDLASGSGEDASLIDQAAATPAPPMSAPMPTARAIRRRDGRLGVRCCPCST